MSNSLISHSVWSRTWFLHDYQNVAAHKKDSCWATCTLPPRCGLCCRWVSTTPWAFPCCSQLVLPEVNRKLLQSWSFYSLYSALCEIKVNIESNFCSRTSPSVEFLLTPKYVLQPLSPVRGVGSSCAMGILVCGERSWVSRKSLSAVPCTSHSSATTGQRPGLSFLGLSLSRQPPRPVTCTETHCPEPYVWAQPKNTLPSSHQTWQ